MKHNHKFIKCHTQFINTIILLHVFLIFLILARFQTVYADFRFSAWSDAQDNDWSSPNLPTTSKQMATVNPVFTIFSGDFENDGFTAAGMVRMINEMNGDLSGATSNGMFSKTFLVRGNHDNHTAGSSSLWQNYLAGLSRPLPSGVSNYVGLNSTSTYLTYSFDYENSRFIGVDVPGDSSLISSAQINFIDSRLTDAENLGLTHVFLYWHGPIYCVESTHCSCTTETASCTPSSIVTLLNKHCINGRSIVSASFHGHEHILGWTHLTNGNDGATTRLSGLSCPLEQFMISPSGQGTYNSYLFPHRMDYVETTSSTRGFAAIDVNGTSYTVHLYRVGSSTPTLKWSRTFSKTIGPTTPPLPSPTPSRTPTPSPYPSPTPTVIQSPTPTTNATNIRPIKYYGVDRASPITDANFQTLKNHSVNTVIVDTFINDSDNGSNNKWAHVKALAATYGFNYVIWPNQGGDYPNCGWETPFANPQNGDYIWRVKTMLDSFASDPHFIGMVSAHEPASDNAICLDNISDMATVKTQLKTYMQAKGRSDFKVWNYIDNVAYNLGHMSGYTASDIERVMDVAVIWEHCFGNNEGPCGGETTSGSAWKKIKDDRAAINAAGLDGKVELVFLFQTFAQGSQYWMPTYDEMNQWSCTFLGTNALDGFIYYTWGAWYDSDLINHTELHPLMNTIYNSCVLEPSATPTIPVKPGDANGDNRVDGQDYVIWLNHYGGVSTGIASGDFNTDNRIDGLDYVIWLNHYAT